MNASIKRSLHFDIGNGLDSMKMQQKQKYDYHDLLYKRLEKFQNSLKHALHVPLPNKL